MKSTSHRLLQAVWTACLVIVFLFPAPVQAADNPPGGPRTPEEMEAFFDQAIPEQLEGRNIPGAVVMAVKDGEVFFEKGYGMANLANQTPVDPESSVFHVASITKLFTWTAVMQLAEQGKLDLAADIQTYLDFEIPTTYDEPVTLQHLMTHTAGFEENNYEYVAAAVDRMVGLGPWLKSHIPARVRRPGEVTAYSNYGTALAGYIVERISGMPYADYIEQYLLQPLEMTHSSARMPLPDSVAANMAVGYRWSNGAYQANDPVISQALPPGVLRATARDMANFMIAHLQDGRYKDTQILSEASARRMHELHFSHDPRINGFAYGFYEMSQNGVRIIGHNGDVAAFHSLLALFPEHNLGLFVSYNGVGGALQQRVILEQFVDHFFPPEPAAPAALAGLDEAPGLSGYYRSTRSSYTSIEAVMILASPTHISAAGDGSLTMSGPLGVQRFRRVEPGVFRLEDGEKLLVFHQDGRGRTLAFDGDDPTSAYEKLPWFETPTLHYGLLAGGLLLILSVFPAAIAWLVRRRKSGSPTPRLVRAVRGMLLAAGVSAVLFLVFFAMAFSDIPAYTRGEVGLTRVALAFPVLMGVLAAGLAAGNVLAWRSRSGPAWERVHLSLATLGLLVFLLVLNYWNMLGWNF